MINKILKLGIVFSLSSLIFSCASSQDLGVDEKQVSQKSIPEDPVQAVMPVIHDRVPEGLPALPEVSREFRGVWLTTVKNADWPSRQDLSSEEQQAELRTMLDRARSLNLNAILFQVRPTADAFYASELEPWSVFLNGKQGRAPDPFYDPLEFAIEEAHARGMELHAWYNPFRANIEGEVEEFADNHVTGTQMVVRYGIYSWLDPGSPEARRHSMDVAIDIVERYDIDGFHMDDYFYPYPIDDDQGEKISFPDDASWMKSSARASGMDRDDWRRQNVDFFVRDLQVAIRASKPWVKFGISPFGIWQPGFPEGIVGFNSREELYADSRKWLMNGWVDYFTPQLYWSVDSPGQSYPLLLSWWVAQNQMNRHLWPGNFTSRITLTGSQYWDAEELLNQIGVTRDTPEAGGNVHFRMISLMPAAHEMGDKLKASFYQNPALIPESPWLKARALPAPQLTVSADGKRVTARLENVDRTDVKQWVIRELLDGEWNVKFIPGGVTTLTVAPESPVQDVAISVVDRIGRESRVIYAKLSH